MKLIFKKSKQIVRENKDLLALIFLILVTRLPTIISGVIPFTFDHGKDSLAVLDMMLNFDVKLIGPWTSIPGLYFGPGWYYLLLPAFVIGGGHPTAPVYLMLILLIVQVVLAYKYVNKWTALIMSTAPIWVTVSTSAWNPFPMTLLSLICLIVLKKSQKKRQLTLVQAGLLGLAAGLGFHFSSAFAVFMPLLILISFIILKLKLKIKAWLTLIINFVLAFVPQILFELTHDFSEIKAVINYFSQPKIRESFFDKFYLVMSTFGQELRGYFLPDIWLPSEIGQTICKAVIILLSIASLLLAVRKIALKHLKFSKTGKKCTFISVSLVWVFLPVIGFVFLHFNLWYILALAPWTAYLFSLILSKTARSMQLIFIVLFVLSPISHQLNFQLNTKKELAKRRDFLPVKIEALDWIRSQADGQAFASYHYAPHIYDFSYQYLYFWQAIKGSPLPVEFSYKPRAVDYVVQKENLLSYFAQKNLLDERETKYVFFIVEKPDNQENLESWWQSQQYSKILETKVVSPQLKVIKAAANSN